MNEISKQILLDFRSGEPLYLQIARQIENLVASGVMKVGDQLPTVREMATELRINFNTVARAYRVLDEAQLISTQRGRGTYIWEAPTEEKMQEIRQQSFIELARKFLADSQELGYSPTEIIQRLQGLLASGAADRPEPDPAGPDTKMN